MASVRQFLWLDHLGMKEPLYLPATAAEIWTEERCFIVELANTPADPDCSIARARVDPGVVTRWHRLQGVAERYVILAGRGRAEIGDMPPREAGPGDVFFIPPGCRQRIANIGTGELIFLAICTPRFQPGCYEDLGD